MNCAECRSLKVSARIYDGEEVTRCWECGFVVAQKVDCPDHSQVVAQPKLERSSTADKRRCLGTNPPNAIDRWLWSQGTKAMSGAELVDAMEARSGSDEF